MYEKWQNGWISRCKFPGQIRWTDSGGVLIKAGVLAREWLQQTESDRTANNIKGTIGDLFRSNRALRIRGPKATVGIEAWML